LVPAEPEMGDTQKKRKGRKAPNRETRFSLGAAGPKTPNTHTNQYE